jgi:hypothetical protein
MSRQDAKNAKKDTTIIRTTEKEFRPSQAQVKRAEA